MTNIKKEIIGYEEYLKILKTSKETGVSFKEALTNRQLEIEKKYQAAIRKEKRQQTAVRKAIKIAREAKIAAYCKRASAAFREEKTATTQSF